MPSPTSQKNVTARGKSTYKRGTTSSLLPERGARGGSGGSRRLGGGVEGGENGGNVSDAIDGVAAGGVVLFGAMVEMRRAENEK